MCTALQRYASARRTYGTWHACIKWAAACALIIANTLGGNVHRSAEVCIGASYLWHLARLHKVGRGVCAYHSQHLGSD